MSENKFISLESLKEYNKQMKETYVKPLEEKIKDCPRTEIVWKEIANGIYTSEYRADVYGLYGAQIYHTESIEIPETMNVIFDGVEYNNLPVGYLAELDIYCIGNMSKSNALGLNYPDTGEPFLVGLDRLGSILFTDLTQSTTHEIAMSMPFENIVKLDHKYMPNDLWATRDEEGNRIIDTYATKNENNRLEAELNGKVITVIFDITTPGTYVQLRNVYGAFEIDWGNGSITPCDPHINNASYTCTYSQTGKYTCKIYGVTSLGANAFQQCYSLKSVVIGDGVTSIGESAFNECLNLTSVVIPNSVTSIGQLAFAACISLTNIIIPDSITSIEGYTFTNCGSLTNVVIPDSVTTIGAYAFASCSSLTSIEIGNGVTNIRDGAFESCSNLIIITFKRYFPAECSNESFNGCNQLSIIYVPYGCADEYQSEWTADGISENIINRIVESDKIANISDVNNIVGDINIALEAILGV